MAIKKNGSRFTDRNRIRKMHAQGYSVQQIADTVSITPEHVSYVVDKWDADEEHWKNKHRADADAKAEAAKVKERPANAAPTIDDAERARIREQARQELLAEQATQAEMFDSVEEETEDETTAEAPAEEKITPRRPRRKKVDEEEAA